MWRLWVLTLLKRLDAELSSTTKRMIADLLEQAAKYLREQAK